MQIKDVLRQVQDAFEEPSFTVGDFQAKSAMYDAISRFPNISGETTSHCAARAKHYARLADEMAARK